VRCSNITVRLRVMINVTALRIIVLLLGDERIIDKSMVYLSAFVTDLRNYGLKHLRTFH